MSLAAVLLAGCLRTSPPSVWLEPIPEAEPPEVEEFVSAGDDCVPQMLVPGTPVTLNCRGQVYTDKEAFDLEWRAQTAPYWETHYRTRVRYSSLERMAGEQLLSDVKRLKRALAIRDWLTALALVTGMAVGVAYTFALSGAF